MSISLAGRRLAARLYVPGSDRGLALVVYVHGGGFVMGDLETHDWLCAATRPRYAHPVPRARLPTRSRAPISRPVSRTSWTQSATWRAHRDEFADADTRLVLMGDSAGANLVTVAATILRDEDLALAAQVLIYPTLGPESGDRSVASLRFGVSLERGLTCATTTASTWASSGSHRSSRHAAAGQRSRARRAGDRRRRRVRSAARRRRRVRRAARALSACPVELLGGGRRWCTAFSRWEASFPKRSQSWTTSPSTLERVVGATRVNVLFITLDQFRGDAYGAAGHPLVRTPTLDRLAE